MRVFFTISILLLLLLSSARAEDPLVVLAAARTGHIEFFDATLAPLGSISVNQLVESLSASPDGRRLYIAQETQRASGACCGLFSLELNTLKMCFLTAPALFGAPSPDGRFLFTQGDRGVDIFSASTLRRLPTMDAPSAYNLQPSPDGRWLLGVTNSPAPSVDIFDLKARAMVRRLPIPAGPVTSAWAGDRFYIFSYGYPGKGQLWSVKPEDTELPQAKPIALPDLHGACNEPVLLMMVGAPDRLYLAEAFGFKLDRRRACPDRPRGGIYAIEPSTGHVDQIALSLHVNRMVVTPDGNDLYALESVGRNPQRDVALLHIDTKNAAFRNYASSPALEPGDWNLALAHIPPALIPRGHLHAAISCSH